MEGEEEEEMVEDAEAFRSFLGPYWNHFGSRWGARVPSESIAHDCIAIYMLRTERPKRER